jgi:cytoskeletal protein RodZ
MRDTFCHLIKPLSLLLFVLAVVWIALAISRGIGVDYSGREILKNNQAAPKRSSESAVQTPMVGEEETASTSGHRTSTSQASVTDEQTSEPSVTIVWPKGGETLNSGQHIQ